MHERERRGMIIYKAFGIFHVHIVGIQYKKGAVERICLQVIS